MIKRPSREGSHFHGTLRNRRSGEKSGTYEIINAAPPPLAEERPRTPNGFLLEAADLNCPETVDLLIRAFGNAGIMFSAHVPSDAECRRHICDVAQWSFAPPEDLLFQDPQSRALVERVQQSFAALASDLSELLESEEVDERTEGKLDLASRLFPERDGAEDLWLHVSFLAEHAESVLRVGAEKAGRGRNPLLLFRELVRRLHVIYLHKTGKRGFYEAAGTATGPFVDLIFVAQTVLPPDMRHTNLKTVGNRVLEALRGNSGDHD